MLYINLEMECILSEQVAMSVPAVLYHGNLPN